MFDLAERVRANAHLLALLSHYARLGSADRTVWQDRVMTVDGVDTDGLTALHGELIALDAVEQNTGHAVRRADGTLAACYRVTPHGLREFRHLNGVEAGEEASDTTDRPPPKAPWRKKERAAAETTVASE